MIDAGGEEIKIGGDPVAVRVLQFRRIARRRRRQVIRDEPGAQQRRRRGGAVKHIRLQAAGARLVENFQCRRSAVGPRIADLDAIFILKGLGERSYRLVHDQRRVPNDLALLFCRGDERSIGRAG